MGALGSRRSPHSSAPEPGPTRHASGERHGRHARHQSPTHAIDGTNGLHAPRRPPVAGPSPQEAETPPLEPRYASPLKATWPARATHSAPQQLPQQPAEESVTSARQDHTSDTPDGCHNKGKWQRADGEAADRLGQLPAIIQDNKLDSPAESFKALVIAGNNVAGARSRRPKGYRATKCRDHPMLHRGNTRTRTPASSRCAIDRSICDVRNNSQISTRPHRRRYAGFGAARLTTCRNARWHRTVSTRTTTEESWINLPD